MIAFSCPACQLKLKVDDKFAGRPAKCPTCKQPLTVPPPSATVAYVPPQHIEGEESSLAKIGHAGGITLDHDPAGRKPTALPGQKPPRSEGEALAGRKQAGKRYVIKDEMARGGMGVVLRADDCDLHREVAVKQLLDDKDPKKKARFIEEAQINAQLEHPNIVPVHDLRIDAQGRPSLIMKLVKGQSLKDVFDQLRENSKQAEKEYTLGRLLNVLISMCNALASAHARGVIHRDLKPANIMLGDYGAAYLMDWGLAKVLKQDPASGVASAPREPADLGALTQPRSPARPSKVVISREPEADLTQEGSVLGTPLYMPPEQASGNAQAIDQRSDVYSLGAILYEMLTLQPPISKEGDFMAIMLRVVQGEIVPPEQREPKRARAGKIPKELAAIAMKALAKEPGNRYPNVEALRKDIERFQEGRSVSAKQDSTREMLWKVVKRNKAVSFVSILALVLLVFIWGKLSWSNYQARLKTDEAYAALKTQTEDAVPALIRAAQLAINERQFDDALKQASLASNYDPKNADASLLKTKLLIVHQDYAKANAELDHYRKLRPNDPRAEAILRACEQAQRDDMATLLRFSHLFTEEKAYGLADGMMRSFGKNAVEAKEKLLGLYRKRIDAAWPGLGVKLALSNEGKYVLNLDGQKQVIHLSPLAGIPLHSLILQNCEQVRDLTPLKGMPLDRLDLGNCKQIGDVSPLKDLPVTWLNLAGCSQVRDLSPLKSMPLSSLFLSGTAIRDLTPLRGLALRSLSVGGCGIQDLSPLKGMPLTSLDLTYIAQIRDLAPLQGMPLKQLGLTSTGVQDLTPLTGMDLEAIVLTPKNITKGIEVMRRMKSLKKIGVSYFTTWDMTPDQFWKRYDAGDFTK